jgi:hypothetical protein
LSPRPLPASSRPSEGIRRSPRSFSRSPAYHIAVLPEPGTKCTSERQPGATMRRRTGVAPLRPPVWDNPRAVEDGP